MIFKLRFVIAVIVSLQTAGLEAAVSAAERSGMVDLYLTTDGDNWTNTNLLVS